VPGVAAGAALDCRRVDHQFLLVAGAGLAASVFARRTGVAAPLLLVGLGIAASYLPSTPTIHVEPELILAGVLPPLLYASAVQLPGLDVRRNFALIAWQSVVMVIVSAPSPRQRSDTGSGCRRD
jgi:NhaP-type Na+/H+ or K+/H+ antiporter